MILFHGKIPHLDNLYLLTGLCSSPQEVRCASTSGMTVGNKIEEDVVLKERLES
jgi:hypothetical protein